MSTEIRWGIVGPGRIADKVVQDFAVVDGARAVAVASRSIDRARAFADEHGIERAHGSYDEILADPEVDGPTHQRRQDQLGERVEGHEQEPQREHAAQRSQEAAE